MNPTIGIAAKDHDSKDVWPIVTQKLPGECEKAGK